MKSRKIEMNSINKLKSILERCNRINTDILDNDRTPSWDGDIFLYNSTSLEKKDMQGVIRVQIKGKKVEGLEAREISYSVDIADLKNFRRVGGTIFFVVYMTNYDDYKIYYNPLLPIDLEEIFINVKNKQQYKNIRLVEFPTEETAIIYILSNFIDDSRKQQSTAKTGFIQNVQFSKYDSLRFSRIFINASYDYLFKYPVYIYGRNESLDIDIPLNKVMLETVANTVNMSMKIGGGTFCQKVIIEFGKNTKKIKIGNAFSLDFNNGKFNYKEKGNFVERIADLKLFIALIKNDFAFEIGNIKTKRTYNHNIDLKVFEKRLNFFNEIEKLKVALHIKDTIDLDRISEEELEQLEIFKNAIIYGELVSFSEKREEIFWTKLNISNWVIAIIARSEGTSYRLSNLFETQNVSCIMRSDNKEEHISSCIYVSLKKENFMELSNIHYGNMQKALFDTRYSKEYGQTANFLILEMLLAFDENNDAQLIESATQIAKWLSNQEKQENIYKLNYLQALLRSRPLSAEENEALIIMKDEEVSKGDHCSFGILMAISIILGNKFDYEYYFKKMNEKEQDDFKKFPIYTLAKKETKW